MQTIKVGNSKLNVNIVRKPSQMAKGLMGISKMPKDEGMLFSYPEEKILSFWMKSTPLPLSIAFIDKNKKIIQIEDLKPFDETSVKSIKPAMWALEVNKGWFCGNKIKIGDKIVLPSRVIKINISRKIEER